MTPNRVASFGVMALVWGALISACSSPSPTAAGNAGNWNGTTAQGSPITFTVSPQEKITSISVSYQFNGCVGTKTFPNLNLDTAPDVTCIPGPCAPSISSYRAFAYSEGGVDRGRDPATTINGLFQSTRSASGVVTFSNYPGCGSAHSVPWNATRR